MPRVAKENATDGQPGALEMHSRAAKRQAEALRPGPKLREKLLEKINEKPKKKVLGPGMRLVKAIKRRANYK